jgi:WD40 repeat protein
LLLEPSLELWNGFKLQQPVVFRASGPAPVGAVNSLTFSADGDRLEAGYGPTGRGELDSRYPSVKRRSVWNLARGALEEPQPEAGVAEGSFPLPGIGVATAEAGQRLVLRRGPKHEVLAELTGYTGSPRSVACSSGLGRIAAVTDDHNLWVWDAKGGPPRARVSVPDAIRRVEFSPQGHWLITGTDPVAKRAGFGPPASGGLRFDERDARTGELRFRSRSAGSRDRDGAGLGDGPAHPYLYAHSLYDAGSLALIRPFNYAGPVAFSPDGASVVTVDHQKVTVAVRGSYRVETLRPTPVALLRDIKTGDVLRRFVGHEDGVSAAAFSPDGSKLLTGSWDNSARLWDVSSGRLLNRFVGHTDYVGAVAFHPQKPWIATGSWDGTARIWDLATSGPLCEREVCRLVSFPGNHWAVLDPDGRYQASGGPRLDYLHWVIDNEPVELHQLELRYWDSQLLSKLYHGRPLKDDVASLSAPGLYPELSAEPPSFERKSLKIQLRNRGGGIGPVWVKVNGKVATEIHAPDANALEYSYTLPLDDGAISSYLAAGQRNRIEVLAFNQGQATELRSRGIPIVIYEPGTGPRRQPRVWAMTVGTSDYDGDALDLMYADKDAQAFAEALRVAVRGLWPDDPIGKRLSIDILTKPAPRGAAGSPLPSADRIRSALDSIEKNATPADVVVLYFSGHGVTLRDGNSDEYVYATWQVTRTAELEDKQLRKSRGILGSELRSWMSRVKARKVVLILDTCEAGGVFGERDKARDLASDRMRVLERLKDRTGTFVLAGSAADRISFESTPYGQGLLTYSLLWGMRGPALEDPGSYVDVLRLLNTAVDHTESLAASLGLQQYPYVSAPEGSRSFPIGIVTSPRDIPLRESPLPLVLPSRFHDEEDGDGLGLNRAVDGLLRDASTRGTDAPLVFVEAKAMPGAFRLAGAYTAEGDRVRVLVRVKRDEKQIAVLSASGTRDQIDKIAASVVELAKPHIKSADKAETRR